MLQKELDRYMLEDDLTGGEKVAQVAYFDFVMV